jgi:hypothetical protein
VVRMVTVPEKHVASHGHSLMESSYILKIVGTKPKKK